jgi:carbamoyltransferase
MTIWKGVDNKLTRVYHAQYPNSLGMFYSAFTKLLGLVPIRDEYILQSMSLKGDSDKFYKKVSEFFNGLLVSTANLHKGVKWDINLNDEQLKYDIAAAVQKVFEDQVSLTMQLARNLTKSDNLVYMGGCAMNSFANKRVVLPLFKNVWSLPNPGDPSSAIGAVLAGLSIRANLGTKLPKHIDNYENEKLIS